MARGHLEVDVVAAGGASGNLVQQLLKLRCAGCSAVRHAQPVAQHIGLAWPGQGLQRGDGRGLAGQRQILRSHFVQQALRLRGVGGTARKGGPECRKSLVQCRQQAGANQVACVAFIRVAGVFYKNVALL